MNVYILSYSDAGFHERTHRLPGFDIFRCFEVLSGFRRLPGLRNPWKLICSITDGGVESGWVSKPLPLCIRHHSNSSQAPPGLPKVCSHYMKIYLLYFMVSNQLPRLLFLAINCCSNQTKSNIYGSPSPRELASLTCWPGVRLNFYQDNPEKSWTMHTWIPDLCVRFPIWQRLVCLGCHFFLCQSIPMVPDPLVRSPRHSVMFSNARFRLA